MPHFIIDCSENILDLKKPKEIMQAVYETAEASGLFAEGDIKVRIRPFEYYQLGDTRESFLHVFGNIMSGRTVAQKAALSHAMIKKLKGIFPDVPIISMNIRDFEKETYCNRTMV
jgi:5-carboxymethyl-2-hydroxymuconate isomerase